MGGHSSFSRKLRFEERAATERCLCLRILEESHCVAEAGTELLACRTCIEKPDTEDR